MTFEEILRELEKAAGKNAVGILVKILKLPTIVGNAAGEMLFPEAAGVPDSDIDWNKAERERLIQEALDAIRNLPTNKPTYTKDKPTVKVPKNSPDKNKINITVQPGFKLPNLPNSLPPTDPFWVPKELVKRVRAISGKSATKRTYGRMECHPISYADNIVFNVVHDVVGTGRKNEDSLNGAKNFMKWLVRENGNLSSRMIEDSMLEGDGVLTGDILWDQVAYIEPHTPNNWLGSIGLKFGAACIANEAADYESTRQNTALGGIKPVIYWNKPSIVVRGSRDVDLSQRFSNQDLSSSRDGLASKIKEVVEYYGERKIKQLNIVNASQAALSKILGVDDFPVLVPRSFVNHTDEELDKILDKKIKNLQGELGKTTDNYLKKAIEAAIAEAEAQKSGRSVYQLLFSVPQQVSWLARVLDEVLGSYPFSITLKDSDLIKVGEQGKTLKIPNIAEALAELEGIGIVNHAATELTINFLIRILTETGVGRMQTVKNYYLLDVLRDWLGVRTKDKEIDVQFAYDPKFILQDDPNTSDEFAKFLAAKTAKVQIEEIDEKITLRKSMQTLDNLALMCKAYMTREAETKEKLKKYIHDAAEALTNTDTKDGDGSDDFDNFLRIIEKGGTDQPGNTLNNKTYGRDYDQRPKTNRLTNNDNAK
jgi:hypothetical protein